LVVVIHNVDLKTTTQEILLTNYYGLHRSRARKKKASPAAAAAPKIARPQHRRGQQRHFDSDEYDAKRSAQRFVFVFAFATGHSRRPRFVLADPVALKVGGVPAERPRTRYNKTSPSTTRRA